MSYYNNQLSAGAFTGNCTQGINFTEYRVKMKQQMKKKKQEEQWLKEKKKKQLQEKQKEDVDMQYSIQTSYKQENAPNFMAYYSNGASSSIQSSSEASDLLNCAPNSQYNFHKSANNQNKGQQSKINIHLSDNK